jgi:hypothetical protein
VAPEEGPSCKKENPQALFFKRAWGIKALKILDFHQPDLGVIETALPHRVLRGVFFRYGSVYMAALR